MSKNSRRPGAKILHEATGMPKSACADLEREHRSWWRQPVPDAATPEQRRFEAMVVLCLAETLRDRQIGQALFGVVGVNLRSDRMVCRLHSRMARRVTESLLPYFDEDYGGIRGVAGARPRIVKGQLVFVDILTGAEIQLSAHDGGPLPVPPPEPGMRALWGSSRISSAELDERAPFESRYPRARGLEANLRASTRDTLLSRLLRRPRFVNLAGSCHGFANTYTHGSDLVLEWCCGNDFREVRSQLDRSGLRYDLPYASNWHGTRESTGSGYAAVDFAESPGSPGPCLLTLRSGGECSDSDILERHYRQLDRWYR